MKLGIMQPYFMPYLGYWQLMAAVDKYVVYDDVNYIKRCWISRNNILLNKGRYLFTISLNSASQNKLINEISIKDDFVKFTKTLTSAYSKAPYYNNVMALMSDICNYNDLTLSKFIKHSFDVILNYLNVGTELIMSSDLEKNNSLKGQEKIIHICQILQADTYINAIGGRELYNKEEFHNAGVNLYFLQSELPPYKQFNNDFIAGLSIIDVLMFNSPAEVKNMLNKYELI